MSPGSAPEENAPPGGRVPLLDYLLRLRRDMEAGRLGMHLGEPDVNRLLGFVTGYHACQASHGLEDTEYGRFREWLRDVKHEFPPEGWAAKYLRDCGGNHEQAIRKYLDFVAEFAALRTK